MTLIAMIVHVAQGMPLGLGASDMGKNIGYRPSGGFSLPSSARPPAMAR